MPLNNKLLKELRKKEIDPDTGQSATLHYISFATEIPYTTLQTMETNPVYSPKADTLKKLADFYRVSIEELLV